MKVFWLISISVFLVAKLFAQLPPKRQFLFSPPGINAAVGVPSHDLVREDRLDLGFSFEYPSTTLWYLHNEKVGFLLDAGFIFYQAYDLGLRSFLRDNTQYVRNRANVDPVTLRSPQIHLGLSYKVGEMLDRQIHGILGYCLKTNSEILAPTYLEDYELYDYDGYYGQDRAFTDLHVASSKLNGRLHHIRLGFAVFTKHPRVIGSLRVWADFHPPYLLEYNIYEVSNPIESHVTTNHKTRSQWLLGLRFEWYGLLVGKVY